MKKVCMISLAFLGGCLSDVMAIFFHKKGKTKI